MAVLEKTTKQQLPFFLYDAFSSTRFGGSQAAIISGADFLDREERVQIAQELGYPATAFVSGVENYTVRVQFFSTVAELPMCGHGTMGLVNCLVDNGDIEWDRSGPLLIMLDLPAGPAQVEVRTRKDGRTLAMLRVRPTKFRNDNVDIERLCTLLGLAESDLAQDLPLETAFSDFSHLAVPLCSLSAMQKITPDFTGIIEFCHDHSIDTVTPFTSEVVNPQFDLHIRDFCPAVGVAESAAAGTTNAAIAGYMFRHGMVQADDNGHINIVAEQGLELGRPSEIHSRLVVDNGEILSQMVGGVATRVLSGTLDIQ
jgi:PhzF family phenazine biosynthesis protein